VEIRQAMGSPQRKYHSSGLNGPIGPIFRTVDISRVAFFLCFFLLIQSQLAAREISLLAIPYLKTTFEQIRGLYYSSAGTGPKG
jgi:hypothetical protein